MSEIRLFELQLHLEKVRIGRKEQELEIMKREQDIARLKNSILASVSREEELKVEIEKLSK